MQDGDQDGGRDKSLEKLSRREIDALVGDLIRAEDEERPAAPGLREGHGQGAASHGWTPPGPLLLARLRRIGAYVSVVLVLCAVAEVAVWWPHYSDGGLPSRPTAYTDGHYAFLLTQPDEPTLPVGYDPCSTVEVEINYLGATPTIRADVVRVIATLDRVSGLHLRYVGASARVLPTVPGRILVSFSEPGVYPGMTPGMVGVGGTAWILPPTAAGISYFASSYVALNMRSYNGSSHDSQLLALARQFGHAVGLANIGGRELMNAEQHHGVHHWGHGDLTGLARLGQLPCRPVRSS